MAGTPGYVDRIREQLARTGHIGIDPRHVEGYMRLEHSTLDGLARWQFNQEVAIGVACIREGGVEQAEQCAKSFGL